MRPYLCLALCSAVAVPCAAFAQTATQLTLTPLPAVERIDPAPPAVTAPPPPAAEAAPPAPELEPPTKVAPVIVAKEDKKGVGVAVGTTVVGVAGGAAGAAVAGPVGKFAGGFVAKRIAQGLLGKKDKIPELTVIPQTPPTAVDPPPAKTTVLAEER